MLLTTAPTHLLKKWEESIQSFDHLTCDDIEKTMMNTWNDHSEEEKLRFYFLRIKKALLFIETKVDQAEEALQQLDNYQYEKNSYFGFLEAFLTGTYLYEIKSYEQAKEHLREAENLIKYAENEIEPAQLHYKIASVYVRLTHYVPAMKHTEKALTIFHKEYDFKKAAHCELLLGIINKLIGDFSEAKIHFKHALKSADMLFDQTVKYTVFQNIAMLHSDLDDSEKAIEYLDKAIDLIPTNKVVIHRIMTTFLLMREHYKINNEDNAIYFYNEGLTLCEKNSVQEYIHHFRVVKAFEELERKEAIESFEKDIEEGISYYENSNLWDYAKEYSAKYAEYLYNKDRFQESSRYFFLAKEAENKLKLKG